MLKGWADKSAARYKPAADPFSFDLQPRADLTAFYVEPAQTRPAVGYLGSAGLDVATPEVFDFLDACPRLDYVISIPKNAVLLRHAEPAMTRARARSARSGRTEHVYGETRYAAGSWKQQRRVVIPVVFLGAVDLKSASPTGTLVAAALAPALIGAPGGSSVDRSKPAS